MRDSVPDHLIPEIEPEVEPAVFRQDNSLFRASPTLRVSRAA
jgi:hypothetical protein